MKYEATNKKGKILNSFKNNLKLHLVLKDNTWRNGYIKEIKKEFLIFEDTENGKEAIFFIDLKKVQPYIQLNKDEKL